VLDWITSISGEARVAIGMPFVAFAFYIWFKAAINLKGMYDNSLDKGNWSIFSLFSSSEFNEQGNYHRKETHKYGLSFILLIGVPLICIALLGGFK
jgi:hypothetical protein